MSRVHFGSAVSRAGLALATLAAIGCETYRVEYHRRPRYYEKMVDDRLPDRVTMDDGTVLVYNPAPRGGNASLGTKDDNVDAEQFAIRKEHEDGTVELRALFPEHVIGNALHCLRLEEYEVIWDQLLSDRARDLYEAEGKGPEEFAAFCAKHRIELAKMLNRLRIGINAYEAVVENKGDGIIEVRFWPQIATLFKFKRVLLERDGPYLKLLAIQ